METEESLEKKVNELIQKDFLKKINENPQFATEYSEAIDKVKSLQERIFGTTTINEYNQQLNEYFSIIFSVLILII